MPEIMRDFPFSPQANKSYPNWLPYGLPTLVSRLDLQHNLVSRSDESVTTVTSLRSAFGASIRESAIRSLPMRSIKFLALASSLLYLAAVSLGQSLGDVAREQKQKKQNQPAAKVITNEDLPAHADDDDQPPVNGHNSNPPSRPLGSKSAEQWKAQIEAQRNTVASLQARLDKLNSFDPLRQRKLRLPLRGVQRKSVEAAGPGASLARPARRSEKETRRAAGSRPPRRFRQRRLGAVTHRYFPT